MDTIIIGGGQAGLATAYHLAKRGREALILDGNERTGDAWRQRWDSLRLFTPAKASGLPGFRFPAPRVSFPTKDEVADYLEAYAARFDLKVVHGVKADGLTRRGDTFVVTAGGKRYEADNVVVATGAYQSPKVPAFAPDLDPDIVQIHSKQYRGPEQLRPGAVLIVGAGNSGAEIARELSKTHRVIVSGKPSAEIPFKHGPAMARFVFPVIKFVGKHVLTTRTPIGRKVRPKMLTMAAPLIRVKMKDLASAGVELVGRTAGVRDGSPVLEDGRVLDVQNVVWCTGFKATHDWIDLPRAFGSQGEPRHTRGVADGEPGLYFIGLHFQFAAASEALPGVGRDAGYIAKQIASRSAGVRTSLVTA